MKWRRLFLIMLALMITLCGCKSREEYVETIHDRIHSNFSDIQSYTSKCKVTIHSQKEHIYNVSLSYNKNKDTYKMDYDDINISISKQEAKIVKGGKELKTRSSDSYMPMFINTFFYYYYSGEKTSIDVSRIKNFGTTTLEAELSENDKNATKQKVWIDNRTALPVKTEIYKSDGSIYIEIAYKNFEFK